MKALPPAAAASNGRLLDDHCHGQREQAGIPKANPITLGVRKQVWNARLHWRRALVADPKLSDGGGWRDGCAGEGGGAASVTAGAVRCSAWLGPGCTWILDLAIEFFGDVLQ